MSHHFTIIPDIIAGSISIILSVVTWSGMMETFDLAQHVATLFVALVTSVYVCYGIVKRHRDIFGKPKP